jgi:alpha-tubulin suppressor-like RCC1 family protein
MDEAVLRQFLTPQPVPMPTRTTVLSVACGSNFTLVVVRDAATGAGLVYSCGSNGYGQLGNGTSVGPKDVQRDPTLAADTNRFLLRPVRRF